MLGIGPGSTLAGRYAVRERRTAGPGWERWTALDTTLDREVVILAFRSDNPHAAAALDAARRAAAATDPRLTQVLDATAPTAPAEVGPTTGRVAIHYVVESPHVGARSLRSILGDGPIPDDEARRIAGEVAAALTEASRIGLHHGSLDLDSVLIDPRGAVVVRGMATEAALRGLDTTGDEVTEADARAIVALLYAALTTRWPLSDPAAPRIGGVLVPPSELVPGVPPALDAAVDEVLGPDARSMRPQDVAAMLKPWSPYPLVDLHSDLRREASIDPLSARTDAKAGDSTPIRADDPAHSPTPSPESHVDPVAATGAVAATGIDRSTSSDRTTGTDPEFEETAISQVLSHEPPLEPDADPLLPDMGTPSRKESHQALGLIGGLVLLLALLGIWGVSRMGASAPSPLPHPTSHGASTTPGGAGAPATAGTSGAAATGDPTSAGTLTPVPVTAGTAYEPQNGGVVASKTAARAYDGKVDTLWVSNAWYQTEKFGGLPIPGLGLILDVGQPTPIRQVTVTVPVAQDFTVLVGGSPTPDGATTIGSVTGQSGQHTFTVPTGTADARYVIVNVTKLGAEGSRFRAQVAEVAISR